MKNCCWHKKEWSEMEKMEELKNLLTANVNKVTELLHKKEKEEIMEEKKKKAVSSNRTVRRCRI